MIVEGTAGRHASSMTEKEALIQLALTAPHSPWISIFRIGDTCDRRKSIAWFPCTLLVSALHGSQRVALEYRSWQPEGTPKFDHREARERFAKFTAHLKSGTWISRNNEGIRSWDLFLRESHVAWSPDSEGEIQTEPRWFPHSASVPALDAARVLRTFCRSGQRDSQITWVANAQHVTKAEPERVARR
jgi:hypothetical protein